MRVEGGGMSWWWRPWEKSWESLSGSGCPVLLAPLAHDGALPVALGRGDSPARREGSRH